ncbi:MAG: ketoacyl-ACP synthase III [Selenomonas sp.]|uniref:3-oxoacyl-ACP synthase III family protein n=1 Tax=Selenomonas sp. TaxID=2053611 RepID=UPI0025D3E061|nr:ketoacyl-ACP synthase III [Selenomonas sp.]MCR5439598.1 ketoacyl-ACP synthase III [Selenomonas sp.]
MIFEYRNKKITGLLTIVPKNIRTFDEEMENYKADKARNKRLKMVMGYEQHRMFDDDVCVSDLAVYGMEYMFREGWLKKEEIDALVLVTQSPDYFMPATSNVIHGRLGLSEDVFCMDINQGCAGFLVGIMQAFSLLDQPTVNKVVLINADVLSRKVSKADRNSYPLIGDAASITVLESCAEENLVQGEICMDGTRSDMLIIPAGGFRRPSSCETAIMHEDEEGNSRSLDNLVMGGREVFYFVQTEVPKLIEKLFGRIHMTKDEIDWWMFHQPNKFMVDKLAEALEVPYEKMPSNIVTYFGNASGVTIPTNVAYNIGEKLEKEEYKICFAGFGVGLTWGAMVMDMGKMDFCRLIEW